MINLAMNPDVFGDNIAFISGDGLWEYNSITGSVTKLVSGLGVINNCRYYENGNKIAFRVMYGESLNASDIFSYDKRNGEVKRLTYLSGPSVPRRMFTDIAGISRRGNLIISTPVFQPFNSLTFLYEIKDEGGHLEPLNLGPAIHILFHNDTIYLGRNTSDMPHWKGYKGGTRGKIWKGNIDKGFSKIVDLKYHLSSPVIFRERIYFIYDAGGQGQICSVDLNGNDFTTHTEFRDYFPRHLNTDGYRIVFSMGGDIYTFDPNVNTVKKIIIGELLKYIDEGQKNTSKYIEHFEMNDDSLISIVSRGRGFITNENVDFNIKIPDSLRVRNIHFVEGNKILYIHGTKDGDRIKIFDYKNRQISTIGNYTGNVFNVKIASDGSFAIFSTDRFELYLLNLVTGELRLIDRSKEDMITDFSISKSSRFVAYSFPVKKTFLGGYVQRFIRLYDIHENRIYNMTTDISDDYSPSFSPDGDYLYFLSSRELDPVSDKQFFNFSYPQISKPYVIPLKENGVNPLDKNIKSLLPDEGEYDLNNAPLRTRAMDIPPSDYRSISITENGIIMFDVPVHGMFNSYYLGAKEKGIIKFYDFKDRKLRDVKNDVVYYCITRNNKKIIYANESGKLISFELDKPDNEKIVNTDSIALITSQTEEFRQMFDETWKMMKDYFWNEQKGAKIADGIYNKYSKLLERVSTRFDLSFVINEMIGEFGTSHCYEMGGEFTQTDFARPGLLGADLNYSNGSLFISKIHAGDVTNEKEKSPLMVAGLKEGDMILEINGSKIGSFHSNKYLLGKVKNSVPFKVMSSTGKEKVVFVKPLDDDKYVRYRSWVESNRKYVHERSNEMIGYVHIPDMGMMGLNEFFRLFVNESSYDSLIIDIRFNGGGFVSQFIMEKIKTERLGYDRPRRGTLHPYPINSIAGGIIAVTNEYAGSDGDIFSHSFKQLKIGKLIGTRTWGGVVGINPLRRLIDGTTVTQPEYAFWFSDVGYSVENYGVDPDVEIEFKPEDYYLGKDPQLDLAIDLLLKELKGRKAELPED